MTHWRTPRKLITTLLFCLCERHFHLILQKSSVEIISTCTVRREMSTFIVMVFQVGCFNTPPCRALSVMMASAFHSSKYCPWSSWRLQNKKPFPCTDIPLKCTRQPQNVMRNQCQFVLLRNGSKIHKRAFSHVILRSDSRCTPFPNFWIHQWPGSPVYPNPSFFRKVSFVISIIVHNVRTVIAIRSFFSWKFKEWSKQRRPDGQ